MKVINVFGDLNHLLYLHGSDKHREFSEYHRKPLPFILLPQSKIVGVWNVILLWLMLYTATYIPYKTAFVDDSSDTVNYVELGIDSLFVVDMLFNFISAYEDNDKNIENRFSRIACNYISSWFAIDFISCIPF